MAALDSILFKDVTDIKIGTNDIYKIVRKGYYPAMTSVYGPSFDLAATRQFVKDNSREGRRMKIEGNLARGYQVYQSDWISNDNTVLWRRIVDMSISVSYTNGNNYFDLVFTKPDATKCTIQYHNGDSKWKEYTGTVSTTGCRFSAESTTSFYIAISHPKYNTSHVNYKLTKTTSGGPYQKIQYYDYGETVNAIIGNRSYWPKNAKPVNWDDGSYTGAAWIIWEYSAPYVTTWSGKYL